MHEDQRPKYAALRAQWARSSPEGRAPIAEAIKAELHLLDAGHEALQTNLDENATLMRDFLARVHR